MQLPSADDLFKTYFAPWYPQEAEPEQSAGCRAELEQIELPKGTPLSVLDPLTEEGRATSQDRVNRMLAAAGDDWLDLLGVEDSPGIEWLQKFDDHFTDENIISLIQNSNPENPSNPLLIICCEAGAVTGEVLRGMYPDLAWQYDWPYWDSAILHTPSVTRLNVFHWVIRRMSEDAHKTRLSDRPALAVEFLKNPDAAE